MKLLYSQSYCIVFAYLVVRKHIRMHARTRTAYVYCILNANTNTLDYTFTLGSPLCIY